MIVAPVILCCITTTPLNFMKVLISRVEDGVGQLLEFLDNFMTGKESRTQCAHHAAAIERLLSK